MKHHVTILVGLAFISLLGYSEPAQILDDTLHHLRQGEPREWSEFPEMPESESLTVNFAAEVGVAPWVIQLRQQDVKGSWAVYLNEVKLGRLLSDENDMARYFEVPAKARRSGQNELKIEQTISKRSKPDDIRVGEIVLRRQSLASLLSEGTVEFDVVDGATNRRTPSRVTIVRADGALPTLGTKSNAQLAVRPGTVYTATGHAEIALPVGEYVVYAGRGFEYSVAHANLTVKAGEPSSITFTIFREVPTEGYVACDTHIHTFTHSRHGDCSMEERMVTLAGEGIELPIATDHNLHIDYEEPARVAKVRQYFTPVIGNEVTTKLGHFNVFPIEKGAVLPDPSGSWDDIFAAIKKTPKVRAIILNHARDIHGVTRPFGPKLHNEAVGENVEGWKLQANAMEVINSGATQTDPLELLHDWMTQLNHGNFMTPVGSSDSHTVNRYIVGQGRTYIRVDDSDPGNIDVDTAAQAFVDGRVLVSYGLLTEMTVDDNYRSGDLVAVAAGDTSVKVGIRVLGPHWVDATRVQLYANGELVREEAIGRGASSTPGIIWTGQWSYDLPPHDVHLVAIATGPGIDDAYWKMAKPYQPTTPEFRSQAIGCSGAIWIDGDADGQRSSARDYARRIIEQSNRDLTGLFSRLESYDVAVATQAAHLYKASGKSIESEEFQVALKKASAATQEGFRRYLDAWRKTANARKAG